MSNFTKPNGGVLRGTAMALTDLPSIATGTALANISGSSTTPTAVSLVSTATASSIMLRDTNANVQTNNFIEGYASTATAASTTTLTVGSAGQQFFTGTTTQTVLLPVTSTLVLGQQFLITNASSGIVTVQSSGANTVIAQPGSSSYLYTCVLTSGTTAASWYAVPYSGGGAVTPTVTTLTSGSGTFTTPANASFLRVRMVGGGGGGSGSGTASGGSGGAGGNTTFGTSLLAANGGSGGVWTSSGAAGGSASLGIGPIGLAIVGGVGGGYSADSISGSSFLSGGIGGESPYFCGGGKAGVGNSAGLPGDTNKGGGGQGGGSGASSTNFSGCGGGSGGYIEAIITSPIATYSYAVGTAGTAGTAGTNGFVGGAGGSGYIEVTTFYNNGAVGTATNVTGIVAVANGGTGLAANYNGRYFSSTTTISGSLATVVYATKGFDDQSSYNNSTGIWTCPATGKYQFNAGIATAGTIALNSALDMQIQQAGSASQISEDLVDGASGLTNLSTSVGDIFNCVAGDTVKVQVSSGATTPTIVSSNSRNYFSWTRIGS